MLKSNIREKWKQGETVTGMIGFIGAPMVIEIMARAQVDFVIIDMEHCPMDMDRLAHLVRAADAAGISPFVRVPNSDAGLIQRVLNLGTEGIVIPHATQENCRAVVQAVRYPPEGARGACPIVRATNYWPEDWDDYAANANREIIILPLLEDKSSIDDFESMAAIPGIDGYFVGPFDLSVSLSVPGAAFDDPKMSEALDRVLEISKRHDKYVVTTVGDRQERDYLKKIIARGVHGLVLATDALVFLRACERLRAYTMG
jgi:4-hydroxy-2-oxoheptanedioate aldolase